MKLTVNQLRRIIKEEVSRRLVEVYEDDDDPSGGYVDPNPMSDEELQAGANITSAWKILLAYNEFMETWYPADRRIDGWWYKLGMLNDVIFKEAEKGNSLVRGGPLLKLRDEVIINSKADLETLKKNQQIFDTVKDAVFKKLQVDDETIKKLKFDPKTLRKLPEEPRSPLSWDEENEEFYESRRRTLRKR